MIISVILRVFLKEVQNFWFHFNTKTFCVFVQSHEGRGELLRGSIVSSEAIELFTERLQILHDNNNLNVKTPSLL